MHDREWVLERLSEGREQKLWRAGFIGSGVIGPIRVAFDPNIIPLVPDMGQRLFRPPCCILQAAAIVYKMKQIRYTKEELADLTRVSWQEIASNPLSLSLEEARAIVLSVGMVPGYDKVLRDEIIQELGLVEKPRETLSLAP